MSLFNPDRMYRTNAVDQKLDVCRKTVYNWIKKGKIVKKIVDDEVVADHVFLEADKLGDNGPYRILGSTLNNFLRRINFHG
jgi:hypothetical protein